MTVKELIRLLNDLPLEDHALQVAVYDVNGNYDLGAEPSKVWLSREQDGSSSVLLIS